MESVFYPGKSIPGDLTNTGRAAQDRRQNADGGVIGEKKRDGKKPGATTTGRPGQPLTFESQFQTDANGSCGQRNSEEKLRGAVTLIELFGYLPALLADEMTRLVKFIGEVGSDVTDTFNEAALVHFLLQ